MKPIQLLKTHEKMLILVLHFYMKIIDNNHTLLYITTINSIQRYNDTSFYELTNIQLYSTY